LVLQRTRSNRSPQSRLRRIELPSFAQRIDDLLDKHEPEQLGTSSSEELAILAATLKTTVLKGESTDASARSAYLAKT
jgi:hypothetical protein